jgi:glycosyltransferase involved in cell wall biosynthesis
MVLPSMGGGGAERVALTLIEGFVARGHEVDLVLAEARGELLALVPPGVRIIDLRAPRLRHAILPLARYLRREKPDVVQVSMWPLTIAGILAKSLARSPARLVVSDHAILSRHYAHSAVARTVLRWTTRWLYPAADHRVLVSAWAADDLAALSGIDREKLEIVHNPISPPASIATNPEVERKWGNGAPRIITVGALKDEKNHALLLHAFARLGGHPAALLMIVGEGTLRAGLEDLAKELGIADRVRMPGFSADPWPFFASADLFVLSSDHEGFGLVLVEAMHAGLRLVSTDCAGGPRDILDGGSYGRLVPPGDADALAEAMAAALQEPANPERMRARAIEFAGPSQLARYEELLLG